MDLSVLSVELYLHLRHRLSGQHGFIYNTRASQQYHITWNQYIRVFRSPYKEIKTNDFTVTVPHTMLYNFLPFA